MQPPPSIPARGGGDFRWELPRSVKGLTMRGAATAGARHRTPALSSGTVVLFMRNTICQDRYLGLFIRAKLLLGSS
jgi:hypothetical protein